MNDFEKINFEPVSDDELGQVCGSEAIIGVDPCSQYRTETDCVNAGCHWQAHNLSCQRTGIRFF